MCIRDRSLLSVANAKLLGDVGRQKSITDYTAKVEDNFERNPDNKFFKKENVFANVNSVSDNQYDSNGKLIKRGLDTDLNEIESAYKNSLRDVKNINADIVVEDFGETLGTISSEWIKANEQETDDDAILKGTKSSGASQRKSGYKYDTSKGYSVPKFTTADEVPDEWVEKFYTRNTAASALMDDYVAKNASKFGSGPDAEMKAKKEFMLNNVLGRLIPDYVGKSANEVDLTRNPGYSGGGGSGAGAPGAELIVTTLAKTFGRDEDIISEDAEATTYFTPKGDAVNVFEVTTNFESIAFGKRPGTDDPLTPSKVYVTSDPLEEDGENTIYVELPGGDVRQYSQKDFTTLVTDITQSGMNNFDLGDFEAVGNKAKDCDVFVNSQYGPDGEQVDILNAVYSKMESGHIINISSTTSYWGDGYSPENYLENKTALDERSKELCKNVCWGNSKVRITNIAFGQLNSKTQKVPITSPSDSQLLAVSML